MPVSDHASGVTVSSTTNLPIHDQRALVEIARDDPDPYVRWAAVWNVNAGALAALAETAPHDDARKAASSRLAGPNLQPFEVQFHYNKEYEKDYKGIYQQ